MTIIAPLLCACGHVFARKLLTGLRVNVRCPKCGAKIAVQT